MDNTVSTSRYDAIIELIKCVQDVMTNTTRNDKIEWAISTTDDIIELLTKEEDE